MGREGEEVRQVGLHRLARPTGEITSSDVVVRGCGGALDEERAEAKMPLSLQELR